MTMLSVVDHHLEHKHQQETMEKKTKQPSSPPRNGTPRKDKASSLSPNRNGKRDSEYEYAARYSMHMKEDKDQAMIETPYGPGLVIRTRKHPKTHKVISRDIELTNWKTAQPKKGPPRPAMLYSSAEFPSVPVKVGCDVRCQFGRGKVLEIRDNRVVVVQVSSWRLQGRSRVNCYFQLSQMQVVRPKRVYEMNVFERVEHAQGLKEEARKIFVKKEYERALSKYALAVDAVRYVQHQKDSTNYVRADLLVLMITCCNNAATCAANEKSVKWDLVSRYARNALELIEALEERQTPTKSTRVFAILEKDGFGSIKVFGEWKGKSVLFLAKAQSEKQNYSKALELCTKAQSAVKKYLDEDPTNKVLLQHEKEIKRIRANCQAKKKLELKKEKQRAQAMFGGGGGGGGTNNGNETKKETPAVEKKPSSMSKPKPPSETNGKKAVEEQPSSKKNVTFEDGGTPRDEYDNEKGRGRDGGQELELPWYEEHQELMILAGILLAGLAVTQMILKRPSRR